MFEESFTLNDEPEIFKACELLSGTIRYLVSRDANAGSPPAVYLNMPSNPQDEKIMNYEEAPPPAELGFTLLSARRWNSYYPTFFPSEGGGYCLISPIGKVILVDVGFGIQSNRNS